MRKQIIAAITICCSMAAMTVYAEDLKEASPAKGAGYYHACNNEASEDILLFSNGTAYSISKGSTELEGPYDYVLYESGDDLVLSADEDRYVYLHWQKEKGKTENNGRYYAIYSNYVGHSGEVEWEEGRQIEYAGLVFDIGYDVYERESLTAFFGIDVTPVGNERIEGDGYDTPEEAFEAYIEGLQNNDIDQMMSAYAMESYVEYYSLADMINRQEAFMPSWGYVPNISDFSARLNLEKRRSDISASIRGQYLVLTRSKSLMEDNAGRVIPLKDSYDSAEEMVEDLFTMDDSPYLSDIRFENEFIDPAEFTEYYMKEPNQMALQRRAAAMGAEEIVAVVGKFYCSGKPVLFMPDAVKLEGKWYLLNALGTIPMIMNMSTYTYGTLPFPDERTYERVLKGELNMTEMETEW